MQVIVIPITALIICLTVIYIQWADIQSKRLSEHDEEFLRTTHRRLDQMDLTVKNALDCNFRTQGRLSDQINEFIEYKKKTDGLVIRAGFNV